MTSPERRITARIRVNLPGRADTDAGQSQAVEVIDLSATGAQVGCPYLAAGNIIPRNRSMVNAVGFTLRLAIGFNGRAPGDQDDTIEAVVAYSRRVSQDDYRFGLRFGEIEVEMLERIMKRIGIAASKN